MVYTIDDGLTGIRENLFTFVPVYGVIDLVLENVLQNTL